MASRAASVARHMAEIKASAARQSRERAMRRYAMEPLKAAMKKHEPPITQMWLRAKLEQHSMRISKTSLNNWINGYCRVPRAFVQTASAIAGANPGDVYARIAGHESVLFQQEPHGK